MWRFSYVIFLCHETIKFYLKEDIKTMKIFAYKEDYQYGITCGVVIAESMDDAKEILKRKLDYELDGSELFEIPFEKGYTLIGSYEE